MKFWVSKRITRIVILLLFIFLAYRVFYLFFGNKREIDFSQSQKLVHLDDNGNNFNILASRNTIREILDEKNIKLGDHDQVSPSLDSQIYPGSNIEIKRALKIKITADGKSIDGYTLSKTISQAVMENGVTLGRLDKTTPDLNSLPQNNMAIIVVRINVEEVTQNEDIDFKTTQKLDNKMGWREKNITTPGEKGIREVKYKVTYKDNKEVSRVVLSKSIVKDPVTQVETQGTYVKCGKANKGQGTWYSYQGGLFAASLTIAKGSYARVTNTANGKSVIVQINDSGPYGKGRIIDLDKVAFQKIADLGAGVIGVKVEEVLN
jgi:uncharacterized protein YabE (DUF348 family)